MSGQAHTRTHPSVCSVGTDSAFRYTRGAALVLLVHSPRLLRHAERKQKALPNWRKPHSPQK
jgi:hypothetical protein